MDAQLTAAAELCQGSRLSGPGRPLPGIRIRRTEHDPAIDRCHPGRHRDQQPMARIPLPVSAVPRFDPGDRDQLLLLLVGGEWLPAERPQGDRATLSRDRPTFLKDKEM